jgi:hypothetical protein
MDLYDIARLRVNNQHLSNQAFTSPRDVVTSCGAVQAQEYAYAKWSVAQRATGLDDAAVEAALTAGDILRTHALRPTWHFLPAGDIRWVQELTGPRVHTVNRSMYRKLEVDAALVGRARDLITLALRDGNDLTRQEISSVLRQGGIEAAGQRLAYIVMHLELDAVLCNGPRRGKQHTYALVAVRSPQATLLPYEEALIELTRRYFTSHGPATVKDYVWWSGLTTRQARAGIALLGEALEQFDLAGMRFYAAAEQPPRDLAIPHVLLLQGFDEYIVGYTESRSALDQEGFARVIPISQFPYWHAIIIDGQVVGHWRWQLRSKSATIELQLGRDLSDAERAALDREAARCADFLGRPVILNFQG